MRALALGLAWFTLLAGCERSYLVPRSAADRVQAIAPDERRNVALPAERDSDGRHVYLRGDAVLLEPVPRDTRMMRGRVGGMHALTTTGIVLILTGALLAGIGGVVWGSLGTEVAACRSRGGALCFDVASLFGGAIEGLAGSQLLAGAVLIPVGATRGGAHEVAAGRPDVLYLDAPARASVAAPGPTVRFSF